MKKNEKVIINKGKPAGAFFLLTYVGVLVYFIDNADGFWQVIFSFIQAAVWPALLIYKVFSILHI